MSFKNTLFFGELASLRLTFATKEALLGATRPSVIPARNRSPGLRWWKRSNARLDHETESVMPMPNPTKPELKSSKPPSQTMTEQIIKLLRRRSGATIAALQNATEWQAHSVPGFLSGIARRRRQLPLISECRSSGVRRYRIVNDRGAGSWARFPRCRR